MTPSWLGSFETLSGLWAARMWQACWQGLLFAAVIWGVCSLARRLPASARCWLWWLACLKLVVVLLGVGAVPLRVLSPGAAPNGLSAMFGWDTAPSGRDSLEPIVRKGPSPLEGAGAEGRNTAPPGPAGPADPRLLTGVWLVGASTLLALGWRQAREFRRLVSAATPVDQTPLGDEGRRLAAEMGLRHPVRVVESQAVTSPLIFDPLRPVLVLPTAYDRILTEPELRMVLAHEFAHLRRHDLWLSLIPALARALFFFFPPAWFAFREWTIAREAACDREALRITGASPAAYADVLLKVVAKDHPYEPHRVAAALGATASFHTLRSRLLLVRAAPVPYRSFTAAAVLPLALLLLPPCQLLPRAYSSAAATPAARAVPAALPRIEDIADITAADLDAEGDPKKRYFLVGPQAGATPPPAGFRLLIVLPGGDGGAQFQPFVRRIRKFALSDAYLVAQPVAVAWSSRQFEQMVWPTRSDPWPGMAFSTEEFIEAIVRDVERRYSLDRRYIFTLGWSSGGPPVYAASLAERTPITGSFVAMSIFHADRLPALRRARRRPFYLLHSPDDTLIPIGAARKAHMALQQQGARTTIQTYAGGHGWRRPVYTTLRRGIHWLEQQVANAPR